MKLKTKRSAAKRIKLTTNGLLKTRKANKSHLLAHKSTKRKRHLGKSRIIEGNIAKNLKIMLGGLN
ncbi:MAG: 50S ribosomal protein L35 [Desulfurella sp.]|uniref:50S ribosomal protein L35 n=1 Tax=Desulfurella sp. TaxID=1962857 RepID=UPI003C8CB6BE